MKLDNFTTARCRKCGWTKQFQPGKEYSAEEFKCDCKAVEPKKVNKFDQLKDLADRLNIPYRSDIKYDTLAKKVKEVQDGTES